MISYTIKMQPCSKMHCPFLVSGYYRRWTLCIKIRKIYQNIVQKDQKASVLSFLQLYKLNNRPKYVKYLTKSTIYVYKYVFFNLLCHWHIGWSKDKKFTKPVNEGSKPCYHLFLESRINLVFNLFLKILDF